MRLKKEQYIHQLTLYPYFFPVNCYVVEEKNELTVVDTGLKQCGKAILKLSQSLKKPISTIILTHAHVDHVGSLDYLTSLHPDIRVAISTRDARLLKGDHSINPNENLPIKGGLPRQIHSNVHDFLKENDRIGSLRVIHTPGHTPGSISLLDERNNMMIVGDALQTRGGLAVSGVFKPLFPFPAYATWDKKLAIESAKKIIQLQPSVIAVGHGEMLHDPCDKLKEAVVYAEMKLT